MSDLISRQAAIDGKISMQRTNGVEVYSDEAVPVEYLKALPSAQPDVPDTNVGDMISRQAAINAINTWDKFGVDERSRVVRWHEGLEPYVHLRDVVAAIGNLPPAQPERPKGEWIEYDNSHCECPFCHEEWSYFDNEVEHFDFCPRCGADMRGEQDE